jgi:hypothetical protein
MAHHAGAGERVHGENGRFGTGIRGMKKIRKTRLTLIRGDVLLATEFSDSPEVDSRIQGSEVFGLTSGP